MCPKWWPAACEERHDYVRLYCLALHLSDYTMMHIINHMVLHTAAVAMLMLKASSEGQLATVNRSELCVCVLRGSTRVILTKNV